jgi:arginine N-succinyltransferase
MNFQEADELNGTHGTQFIADLMPKTPIYTADAARQREERDGRTPSFRARGDEDAGARRLPYDCYIDIFDGGPTMAARTDEIRTVRDSREHVLAAVSTRSRASG